MGLDTVELVLDFEAYFGIKIPNKDAAGLSTIQKTVDYICSAKQISGITSSLKTTTLNKLITALKALNPSITHLNGDSSAGIVFNPSGAAHLDFLSKAIGLGLPGFGKADISHVTIEQLNDAINMHNLTHLVNAASITDAYEVYLAIGKLTVDKSGVEYLEIQPQKSYTSDLGLD